MIPPSLQAWFAALGVGLALYVAYSVLDFIWLYAVPVPRSRGLARYLHRDASGQPPWALVTGASDGIGLALSGELAAAGFNVVLHGRSPAKLARARDALSRAHPARSFRLLVADAASPSLYSASSLHPPPPPPPSSSSPDEPDAFDLAVVAPLAPLHLTVVVNNAGAGPAPRTFAPLAAHPRAAVLDALRLNAAFPALVAAALVPRLRLRAPALLLNVASVSDEGLPLLSFYGAAKAAAHVLHVALAREEGEGGQGEGEGEVEVLSHRVGAVTGVSRVRDPPSLFRPRADAVARAILARTGCGRRGAVVPYWAHALQQAGLGLLPGWARERLVARVMWDLYRRQEGQEEKKGE
ncbi:hypothetical protein F4809DRAFT_646155 [Biscogniauxia mediterranea]|nr:hypothetical protein F4809DRAFT_646155 [Biscogniauxia mediterranea]